MAIKTNPPPLLVVLLGSIVGGIAGSVVADTFVEELKELSHWEIF
jgi:hypothetical protein